MKREYASRFDFVSETYAGNIAYIFVLQSLILRIPLGLKRFYTPALLRLESLLQRFQRPQLSMFVVGQWRKKGPHPADG